MEIKDIIYLGIAVVSALFGIIMWVRKPQEKSEVNDAVFDEKFKNLKENTDRRFSEMVLGFNKSIELALNHSHTVETKIDSHIKESQDKSDRDSKWQGSIEAKIDHLINKK